jgi:hypothetical protein
MKYYLIVQGSDLENVKLVGNDMLSRQVSGTQKKSWVPTRLTQK